MASALSQSSSVSAGRPQLDLDGTWAFTFSPVAGEAAGAPRSIRVPGIWQAQFGDLRNMPGIGRYTRAVDLPSDWSGERLVLVFEGVFHLAKVWVDGTAVAEHSNAWTIFEADITDAVAGKAHFELVVEATVPDDQNYSEAGFGDLLHGKQDWYGLQGGIWKSVRLEARSGAHLQDVAVRAETDLANHKVVVAGRLSTPLAGAVLDVVVSTSGETVASGIVSIGADGIFAGEVAVEAVELWSPDAPNLYDVRLSLADASGQPLDSLTRPVGFRLFQSREDRLFLNGEPFYLFAALDQDWYPEEECRSPDDAFLEQRFRNAKAIGLNALRCHVKIPDKLYFDLADRLGILIWLDMPYTEFLTAKARQQTVETFEQSVISHGHHPSICIWTIMNEGWGIDLDDNPDDRAWLKEEFDRLKPLVPTSLLVDNSPCAPRNYHVKTDIDDFHWYFGWPGQNDEFERLTKQFANRPSWTFSAHGDAVRSGHEPLVCSEFGVWGLPHPKDILEKDGSEPWWFESGFDWNSGCAYPHGMETRFRDARLGSIFGDLDGFVDAAQDTQFRALKFQIETLRLQANISGYVITELNDCQWEANGLMDARNNLRAYAPKLAKLQEKFLVVARAKSTSVVPGQAIHVDIEVTSALPLPEGTRLHWNFDDDAGEVGLHGRSATLALFAPSATAIDIARLELTALDGAGTVLSTNFLEFCIVPDLGLDAPALWAADATAAALLQRLAWPNLAASAETADRILASHLTTPIREFVLEGHHVLLIANQADALIDPVRGLPKSDLQNFPKMNLVERDGTPWDGRWMGAFGWRRIDGPWAGLPNGPMLDEHWHGLIPRFVLTGFRSTAFNGLVDAGMAVAWLHKAVAFSKRTFLGKGWLTVSTFDLLSEEAIANPLARHVLQALARS